ncbi:probable transcription factor At5g28040 isoform X1 [Beta vulgaris subsp. vulgaris]|uniref:probable transcription factor At5g28040 isoform X1 n=1 Tax=Beta vulgaris subsp. vulgaris TaxID=3555 RepID=UPI002036AE90|nr:probable transcription factor At5g28040 isoform X1 [Beta vulgaris subsp. vulgaris]
MAFEVEPHPPFNDDDFDDDDDDSEPLNGAVPDDDVAGDSDSSSAGDSVIAGDVEADSTAVTVAIPSSSISVAVSVPPPTSVNAVTIALPDPKRHRIDPLVSSSLIVTPEKKPIDDSRRLFQRLWTDEDEIELLQGFLEYTSSRGTTSSGHHHDTAAFYDQIKSKLQLEFNKNQLVEKLRRLKKKYRNVLSKMSSGKDFVFKSPHDQATFEISRKIWTNLSPNFRGVVEFDDDDQNPNPNPNSVLAAGTPPRPPNSSFVISHINLNSAAGGSTPMMVDHKAGSTGSYNNNNNNSINSNAVGFDIMMSNLNSPAAKLSSRKRPRVKVEEKFGRNVSLGGNVGGEGGINVNENSINHNANNNNTNNISSSNINLGSTMQGLIEEAVRSCLSPLVKDLVSNAVNGTVMAGSGGGGIKGVGALALNAVPLNFSGPNLVGNNGGDVMDEKWRKQQILELEVYSKRLELVQDQIKLSLEELRSMGS